MRSKRILIDFDGTCVTNEFPKVGSSIGAESVLRELVDNGHKLILFTMRCNHDFEPCSDDPNIVNISGNFLDDAIKWFDDNDIPLYGIQKDPEQHKWTSSNKAYANIIIDDTSLGIPVKYDRRGVKYVDWLEVRWLLVMNGIIK